MAHCTEVKPGRSMKDKSKLQASEMLFLSSVVRKGRTDQKTNSY